ncbi:response regulator [bacterium]|nr:response regulator [bacterium]
MIKKVTAKFNARILVVDDYIDNQELARTLLEKMECEVDVAEDGLEAVEMVRDADYDAVFMDIQLPELDGYGATRQIREAEGSKKHTPIIALTANALEGDKEKCLKAGMDDYLAKPFRGEDIERVLSRFLKPE